jgi:hypothetical protein
MGVRLTIRELPLEEVASLGQDVPLRGRVLRRLEDGTIRSAVLAVDASSRSRAARPVVRSGAETWFGLRGFVRLDGREFGPRDILHCDAGSAFRELWSDGEAELLRITWPAGPAGGAPASTGSDGATRKPVAASLDAAGWIDVRLPGVPPGIRRAELLGDPVSGGDLRALQIPGGFEGKGPNWHPCGEEILCLRGDVAPDDEITLREGDYLFNPARSIHGQHEHSHEGALLVEWHDGPWSINFL